MERELCIMLEETAAVAGSLFHIISLQYPRRCCYLLIITQITMTTTKTCGEASPVLATVQNLRMFFLGHVCLISWFAMVHRNGGMKEMKEMKENNNPEEEDEDYQDEGCVRIDHLVPSRPGFPPAHVRFGKTCYLQCTNPKVITRCNGGSACTGAIVAGKNCDHGSCSLWYDENGPTIQDLLSGMGIPRIVTRDELLAVLSL